MHRFQTDKPSVPVLVDTLEEFVWEICTRFALDDFMEKASSTAALIKLNNLDANIHKNIVNVRFGVRHEIKTLKKIRKVTDIQINNFLKEVKQFFSTFCHLILSKSQINSQFTMYYRSLNPFYMTEYPEKFSKLFDVILQKLIALRHITSTDADSVKSVQIFCILLLRKIYHDSKNLMLIIRD